MKATYQLAAVVVLLGGELFGQGTTNASSAGVSAPTPWAFNFVADGYVVPNDQSYVSPTFTADRKWLHMEARYNYENLRTGSLWAGYNFSVGKTLVFDVTPMIGSRPRPPAIHGRQPDGPEGFAEH